MFKYEIAWKEEENYAKVVENSWPFDVDIVLCMRGLLRKLGNCRRKLKVNKKVVGYRGKLLKNLSDKLSQVEAGGALSWEEHKVLQMEIDSVRKKEELCWG